jgi:hypothetical protein
VDEEVSRINQAITTRGGLAKRGGLMRLARVVGVIALPLFGLAFAFYGGLFPNSSSEVTIDHCYVKYSMQEVASYSCDGHWIRIGRADSGPIYGVDAAQYRALEEVDPTVPGSDGNGRLYLVVPKEDSQRAGIADPFVAYVIPSWAAFAVKLLSAVLLIVWFALVFVTAGEERTRTSGSEE